MIVQQSDAGHRVARPRSEDKPFIAIVRAVSARSAAGRGAVDEHGGRPMPSGENPLKPRTLCSRTNGSDRTRARGVYSNFWADTTLLKHWHASDRHRPPRSVRCFNELV